MTLETGGGSSGDLTSNELDDFLERAVERQIAEQQALRQTLTALTQAVNSMSAPGVGAAPSLDPEDIADQVRAAVRSAIDPLIGEIRSLADDITQAVRSVPEPAAGSTASVTGGAELQGLTTAVDGVSADVEGIAQALIDLNSGLRDWAEGVDRNIWAMRQTVEQVREIADVTRSARASDEDADDEAEEPGTQIVQAQPVAPAMVASDPGELEERVRESIELALYLADQVEEFDRVLKGMGDLPTRLEGIISQGMRRTLAARSKLDSDVNATLEGTLSLLDSYVERMSTAVEGFTQSEETLRKLGLGQVELASRLDSLYEAVHELASGSETRAASLTRPAPRAGRETKKAKPKAQAQNRAQTKARTQAKAKKPAKRQAKRTSRKSSPPDSTH